MGIHTEIPPSAIQIANGISSGSHPRSYTPTDTETHDNNIFRYISKQHSRLSRLREDLSLFMSAYRGKSTRLEASTPTRLMLIY